MPSWIFKVMPWRDWAYAGIAVAAVIFYNVHVHNLVVAGQKQQAVAIAAASEKVRTAADIEKATMTADYTARLAATQEKLDENIKANAAAHAADLAKLQLYADREHSRDAALLGAASSGVQPGSPGGSGSAEGLGQLPEFAIVSLGLADALRTDDGLLASCRADRDALTGK